MAIKITGCHLPHGRTQSFYLENGVYKTASGEIVDGSKIREDDGGRGIVGLGFLVLLGILFYGLFIAKG